MNENPFTLTFGKIPSHFISRPAESGEIISSFLQDPSPIQTFLITGVRGSGKTALLAYVSADLERRDDWVVIDVNPEKDILTSLASKLYEKGKAKQLFLKMNLSFSFHGISLSV
ncbi:MAG: P-loop NTPase fold protein [Candidatus Enteromonas sp.]